MHVVAKQLWRMLTDKEGMPAKSSFMILEHPGSSGGSKRGRLGFGYAAPLVA